MRKLLFFLTAITLLFIPSVTFANDSKKEERVVLRAGETVNEDYFATGEVVEISGTVNGDVYAFAGQVLIDGTVNGDLIAAGGTVNVSGEVTQDVRVGGGSLLLSGKVGRNVTVGGGNVEITDKATIAGGAVIGGGNVTIAAPIEKSLRVGAGNVTISNRVGGNLFAAVGSIRLTSKAAVAGNFEYWSDNEASIDQDAKVTGIVTKNDPARDTPSPTEVAGFFSGVDLFLKLVSLFSTLLIGFLLIRFFPGFMSLTNSTLKERFGASLLWGLVYLILTPIVGVILLATLIGIPLAFILFTAYFSALFVCRVFVVNWLGEQVSSRFGWKVSPYLVLLLGIAIYYVLTLIPIVSGLISLAVVLVGLGALVLSLNNQYRSSKLAKS